MCCPILASPFLGAFSQHRAMPLDASMTTFSSAQPTDDGENLTDADRFGWRSLVLFSVLLVEWSDIAKHHFRWSRLLYVLSVRSHRN